MSRVKSLILILILLVCGLVITNTQARAQNGYTSTVLGTLGGSYSGATDVNDSGMVVGYSSLATNQVHAFAWTQSGGMVDLGTLGSTFSFAYAVNNNGMVVGESRTATGQTRAFAWTQSGGMVDLGTLGGGSSQAFGVNNNGMVIGISADSNNWTHAFAWTHSGGMVDLGALGTGVTSVPTAVNNNGMVVGYSGTNSSGNLTHAFAWTQSGGMVDLGSLGGNVSYATDVNDNNVVTGSSIIANSNNDYQAFTWTQSGGMADLTQSHGSPSLGDAINSSNLVAGSMNYNQAMLWSPVNGPMPLGLLGGLSSHATDVNVNGVVIGRSDVDTSYDGYNLDFHAFVWTQAAGITKLSTSDGPISEAKSINASGQIAGMESVLNYTLNWYDMRAVLWTPVGNTTLGTNVSVVPVDTTGGATPITISFGNVTSGGETTLTTTTTGAPPPSGFKIGNPPVFYNLETTATFTGSATLCINYSAIAYGNVNNLKLFHYEGNQWVDRTVSLHTATNTICATVTSFSPFALFETAYTFTGFFAPVDNGAVINSVKAGSAVPIKFSLGGDKGLGILETGFPASIAIPCDSSAVDAIEETSTAGSSSLSYDSITTQYKYVWKTEKSWTGCRQFVLKLNDGSTKTAKFKF